MRIGGKRKEKIRKAWVGTSKKIRGRVAEAKRRSKKGRG